MHDKFRVPAENDMLHGNEEFGALMMQEALNFLQSKS
jgi:hypothetical protein